ncbi:MAG: DNA repair protein RecO [Elusimicrobiota bacterium]|nr:DNA repair protein RecO [Elusimicrobiota bacterium]
MYIKRTEGIVIKSRDYGEGHRIVVIFTRRMGKVSAVAKGSRKIKSKFGASLEPLTVNDFMLYRKPGRDLAVITGCSTVKSNIDLREDMGIYSRCALMMECVEILNTEDDPHPQIYNLFKGALDEISCRKEKAPSVSWLFIFMLLKHVGYRLNFFRCGLCKRKEFKSPRFFPDEGSVYCRKCSKGKERSWPVSPSVLASIRKLDTDLNLTVMDDREIGNIIQKFIEYEFGKKLKSIKFLERISYKDNDSDKNFAIKLKKECISRN